LSTSRSARRSSRITSPIPWCARSGTTNTRDIARASASRRSPRSKTRSARCSWSRGALLTTAFAQAALSRTDTPAAERRTFHLYADEFQSFATESFALILSEARKYALTLTIGHQYLDQLPDDLRAAVFGNAGSIIACRAGAEDAAILARQIGLGGPDALLDLSNFTAWARLLRGGAPSSPIRLDLFDAPRARRLDAHRLINASRLRFGRPRAEVEARISRFLGVA
jgi:hypothetical protein